MQFFGYKIIILMMRITNIQPMGVRGLVSAVGGLQDAQRHRYRRPAVWRSHGVFVSVFTHVFEAVFMYLSVFISVFIFVFVFVFVCICIASWLPTTCCLAVARSQNIGGAILGDWIWPGKHLD